MRLCFHTKNDSQVFSILFTFKGVLNRNSSPGEEVVFVAESDLTGKYDNKWSVDCMSTYEAVNMDNSRSF